MPTLTRVLLALSFSLVLASSLALAQPSASGPQARPGVDVLLESPGLLQGRRIGLVTHAAGLTSSGETTWNSLLRDPRFTVAALFAPEHGLAGTIPAANAVLTFKSPPVNNVNPSIVPLAGSNPNASFTG